MVLQVITRRRFVVQVEGAPTRAQGLDDESSIDSAVCRCFCSSTGVSGSAGRAEVENRRPPEPLLGQNQLALPGALEPIELALVLDPNFFAAPSEVLESNDLGSNFPIPNAVFLQRRRTIDRGFIRGKIHKSFDGNGLELLCSIRSSLL